MKKIIFFLIISLIPLDANAHVGHHKNLKSLDFEIYRNGKYAGFHTIDFNWSKDGALSVKNVIEFGVKKLGITLYKYSSIGTEEYNSSGKLKKFLSKTNDNGKEKYCSIQLDDQKYDVKGTKYDGEFTKPFLISSYWNHDIVTVMTQISGITCRVQSQAVVFLREEDFVVNGKNFKTRVFDIKGDKLDTQVWFDQDTRMLVHQVLNKKGKWEYKLKSYQLNK